MVNFYLGIHHPSDAKRLGPVFVSVHTLVGPKGRRSRFTDKPWIMDSGAFTTIAKHGGYPEPPAAYAATIRKWAAPNLIAAVSQDYMCEPMMLAKTGKTVLEHQALTIERYDDLRALDLGGVYLMPVLQGYEPVDYARHVRAYGSRLAPGVWVGVGSVCKRNGRPGAVLAVLEAILGERPDLKLHGFGLKLTSLAVRDIRDRLHSADSLAWSYRGRREGNSGQNDWRNAAVYAEKVERLSG